MRKIELLSDDTIIKIAAGEIIENPSSVIKELVENSIDANADKIMIEIENNASSLIKVTDNGTGFEKEDVKVAFKRHTTSKIKSIHDLDFSTSLGFRGEALSSIASVSDVELITKTENDKTGIIANFDHNGNIVRIEEIATNVGSSISCRNIFKNMPVRRTYLENKNFEIRETNDIINKLALSNPNISISYLKDSKLVLKTLKNTDMLNNIFSVLGKSVADNLIPINLEGKIFKIKGFISNNELYKANRKSQYIFINNRSVDDRDLTKLIEDAYKSTIPLNKFPVFIIYLNIKPEFLDVNIHPKKNIVKILNIEDIKEKLYPYICDTLVGKFSIHSFENKTEPKKETIFDYFSDEKPQEKSFETEILTVNDFTSEYKPAVNQDEYEIPRPLEEFNFVNEEYKFEEKSELKNKILPNGYRFIGILFKQYILLEENIEKAMYIIDQHAAHERINYERFKKAYENKRVVSQRLMDGFLINLNLNEYNILNEIKDSLENLGFEIDSFGENTVILRAVPVYAMINEPEKLIREIIESEKCVKNLYQINPYKIMTMACKASVKKGDYLNSSEVNALIKSLNQCEMPFTCPHGRPTLIKITQNFLDKEFYRLVNNGQN